MMCVQVISDFVSASSELTLVLAQTGATSSSRLRPPSLANPKSTQVGRRVILQRIFCEAPIADNRCVGYPLVSTCSWA